jgi:metal-responsive CopG/Arc/MetJ family transcriptional regulator
MDIIAVHGYAYRLTELSVKLVGLKGIKHGKLIMSQSFEDSQTLKTNN